MAREEKKLNFKKKNKILLKDRSDIWLARSIKLTDRLVYFCVGAAYLLTAIMAVEVFTYINYTQAQIDMAAIALVMVSGAFVFTVNQRYESEKRLREMFASLTQHPTEGEQK